MPCSGIRRSRRIWGKRVATDALFVPLADGVVHLEPLDEEHREPLRAACAEDETIWEIYPCRMIGEDFDPAFDAITANRARFAYAVFAGGVLIGTTSWLSPSPADRTVEIGGTYIAPPARGTGVNDHVKRLMIGHAFALGFHRVEFRIDVRNRRSIAAVEKLGAKFEGVMRRHRITWTGHIRDTALYSLLPEEWAGR